MLAEVLPLVGVGGHGLGLRRPGPVAGGVVVGWSAVETKGRTLEERNA
ncbi:hypothetical protein ACFZCG_32785 [Streptomyces tanashiensis]